MSLAIPELYCPFPAALSKYAEAAERDAEQWAGRIGLGGGADRLNLAGNAVGHLSGYVHPWASSEDVAIGARWVTWLFAYDDALVERVRQDSQVDMRAIGSLQSRVLAAASGRSNAVDDQPLLAAIRDIRSVLLRRHPHWEPGQFVSDLTDFLHSNRWEIANSLRGSPPRLGGYLHMRRHTSSYYPCYRISGALADIRLPAEVRGHVAVRQLEIMANNYGSWLNDLYSFESEHAEGTVHNLVQVLRREYGGSVQDAVDRAAEMCRTEIESYVEMKSRLAEIGLDADGELGRYLRHVLEPWMRGILDWHKMTPRYRRHRESVA